VPDWRGTFNIPAEKCYRAILNYIRAGSINKKDRVVFSLEPSLIVVKTGTKDVLKIRIIPEGNKSTVLMDFDFGSETAIYLMGGMVMPLVVALQRENKVRTIYTGRISDLLKYVEQTGVIPEFKEEPKPPVDVKALYERLIRAYSTLYSGGARMVDRKIQSYMKTGLSREEAIKKLAEEEGILERAETKPRIEVEEKLKPSPDILYQRLVDRYSRIYGRSISALEHKIEEYMWEGLSREEAIKRLAWEEGIA